MCWLKEAREKLWKEIQYEGSQETTWSEAVTERLLVI